MLDNTQAQMDNLARMPDGKNSLGYAQLGQQKRGYQTSAWQERDYLQYGQRMEGMQTDAAIHQTLPYTPGFDMKMSLERMGERSGQMNVIADRYKTGMKDPSKFGVDQQQATYSEYQKLRREQASDIAVLSEGGEDRAMLMSAGRPASFNRYDSSQLAATALYNVGSPIRKQGAINGDQLKDQQDFLKKHNKNGLDATFVSNPKDRMSNMDNSAIAGIHSLSGESRYGLGDIAADGGGPRSVDTVHSTAGEKTKGKAHGEHVPSFAGGERHGTFLQEAMANGGGRNRAHGTILGDAIAKRNKLAQEEGSKVAPAEGAPAPSGSGLGSGDALSLLKRIADAVENKGNGSSGGARTGELRGSVGSALNLNDITGTPPPHTN